MKKDRMAFGCMCHRSEKTMQEDDDEDDLQECSSHDPWVSRTQATNKPKTPKASVGRLLCLVMLLYRYSYRNPNGFFLLIFLR